MANELRIASACRYLPIFAPFRFRHTHAHLVSGPDPSTNPRLATLILSAKKQGVPKSSIESAIARGQGKLSNGQTLESVVVEAMIPPSVATIIECHTDSKLRTLADVKLAIKECGGSVSSTNHLFKRKGKIIFGKSFGKGDEDAFEKLIDSITIGADFIDDDKLEVYTEPSQMNAAAVAIGNVSAREIESKEIIWDPIPEMMVDLTSGDASSGDALNELICKIGTLSKGAGLICRSSFGR